MALGEGSSIKKGLRSLNLSDDQRAQVRAIHDASRGQIEAVLSEEQRQQLSALHERRGRGSGGHLERLNLTAAQSAQIEAIRSGERTQMESVLTADQRAALAEGEMGKRAWRALDLTDAQKEQLRAIHEATHEQINAVLTEEQRQQLPARGRRDRDRDS